MHQRWRREGRSAHCLQWRSEVSLGRQVVGQSAREDQTMFHDRRVSQNLLHVESAHNHEGLKEGQ